MPSSLNHEQGHEVWQNYWICPEPTCLCFSFTKKLAKEWGAQIQGKGVVLYMARTTKWCVQMCTVSSIFRPICVFHLVAFVWNTGSVMVPGMLLAIVNWWSYRPKDAQFVICCDSVDRDPDRTDRPSAWCASKSARWWYYACLAVTPHFCAYSV